MWFINLEIIVNRCKKLYSNIPYTYHVQGVQDSLEILLCEDFSIKKKIK